MNKDHVLLNGKTISQWVFAVAGEAVSFEIEPCRKDDGSVEVVKPHLASFWTVYGRDADGLAFEIIDCCTRDDAQAVAFMLDTIRAVRLAIGGGKDVRR